MEQYARRSLEAINAGMLEQKKNNVEQNKFLEKITKTNENVEEALCNVLLAIRQNEYLQAWYPAQNGIPEQRVVGKYVPKEAK